MSYTRKMPIEQCIAPGCDRPAYARGLCRKCYQLARLYVLSGKGTWERLVEAGYAKDVKSSSTEFVRQLHKMDEADRQAQKERYLNEQE